jgi:hypothetical protein
MIKLIGYIDKVYTLMVPEPICDDRLLANNTVLFIYRLKLEHISEHMFVRFLNNYKTSTSITSCLFSRKLTK